MSLDPARPEPASLLADAAGGNADALARLMALHDGSMRRICMVITGDTAMVDEAVQLAWVRAWRRMGTLRDESRLRAWLMSIAANEARQQVRAAARRRTREVQGALPHPAVDPSLSDDLLDLADALARLSPDDRRLIALRHLGGLSSDEMARELGGSASSVRGRLARALERLRTELNR